MVKEVLVLLAIFGVAQCKPASPQPSLEEIDAMAIEIFNKYDKNGDNKWSFEEAAEWMKDNKGLQAYFESVFNVIDADADGKITFEEHLKGLRRSGSPKIDKDKGKAEKARFDSFATNGTGEWNLDEAKQFMMVGKFNNVDGNKDGIITLDELKRAFGITE